jgi:TatA/E family protein of Tat protein translocase
MLDIGFQELLIIMVIALMVFGPQKLPELGRKLGRAMREFRRASDEFRTTIETNLQINDDGGSILPPSAAPEPMPATGGVEGGTIAAGADPAAGASWPMTASADAGGAGVAGFEPRPPGEAPAAGSGDPLRLEVVEPFCARRGGRLLHRSACGWVTRIAESERIAFKRAGEGAELGLMRCPACDPQDADAAA